MGAEKCAKTALLDDLVSSQSGYILCRVFLINVLPKIEGIMRSIFSGCFSRLASLPVLMSRAVVTTVTVVVGGMPVRSNASHSPTYRRRSDQFYLAWPNSAVPMMLNATGSLARPPNTPTH